jgi:hypothetical protein
MYKPFFLIFAGGLFLWNCQPTPNKETMSTHPGSLIVAQVADSTDANNNFYDNAETYTLPAGELVIAGEIMNPGKVDFTALPKRSVIVKEALLTGDSANSFVGAYRYDGYSIFDILNDRKLNKNNKEEFPPIIDSYVEIENDKGEKVVLSWGEIYYPNVLHNIIIATDVARIVPSKTKDLWPLPDVWKLIVLNDLLTERNIINPVKITVKSWDEKIPVNRDISPLYSPGIRLTLRGNELSTWTSVPGNYQNETLHTIFYGKGRGIHSTQPFTGIYLKEVLKTWMKPGRPELQQTLVAIIGADGYRSVFSLSEILNRNDQAEILLVPCEIETDGGKFRIFPACDFFSDRAVKAVSEIRIR